jgi:prepilin-type N-terminal cleavage/methylation domain-containing protein
MNNNLQNSPRRRAARPLPLPNSMGKYGFVQGGTRASASDDFRRGFTLLELLVAGALIAVAATVVAGAFAAGFRVWQRASQQGGGYEDAIIALELIQKDIRNTEPFRLIPFKGSDSDIEIPSIIAGLGPNGAQNQPGSIRYVFSATSRRLERVKKTVIVPGGELESREQVMDNVESVRFSYADCGPDGKSAVTWSGAWPAGTNIPVAVKVQVKAPPLIDLERIVVLP